MRQIPRQQALRMVVCAALATVATMAGGCDAGSAADAKAADAISKGDYQAAVKEKNASPAVNALSAAAAASQQYASSLPAYRGINDQQVAISQTLWQIGALTLTAERIVRSSDELNKYKPDAALAVLDLTVLLVKGDGKQAWSPAEGVELQTASASAAKTNELKDRIAEVQRTLADMKQQHERLVAQTQDLLDQSDNTQGEQSVQLFRQSADARKQAADLAVRIGQAEASLVPLQQDLAVAENQVQQYAQMIENFAGERDEIEKSWRGVSAQIDQQVVYAGLVYSRQDDPRFSSIASKARELAQLTGDYDKLSEEYQRQLEGASALARDSVSSSEKAIKALPLSQGSSKGTTPEALLRATLEPTSSRVMQGQIDYSTGSLLANRASLYAHELRTAEAVAQLGTLLKQPAPENLNAGAIEKLKTEYAETMTKAGETLGAAGDLFGSVAEARSATADTKRAATIGKMLALNASCDVSQINGDSAAAKQSLDEAKALRDSLLESGMLSNLPAALAADLPSRAASGSPTSAPATGPVEKD